MTTTNNCIAVPVSFHLIFDMMTTGYRFSQAGFIVRFERIDGIMLRSDFFPNIRIGELPIATEEDAWKQAERFAAKTKGRCVNIYVANSEDTKPVPNYQKRRIENRLETKRASFILTAIKRFICIKLSCR